MSDDAIIHAGQRLAWIRQLSRHAKAQRDHSAIRFRGRSTTWAELEERSRRLAGALQARSVSKGDRVIPLATNRPEFIEAFLAIGRLGAIAVPLNFRLAPYEIAYLVRNSGARCVNVEDILTSRITEIWAETLDGTRCLVVGVPPEDAGTCAEAYEGAISAAEPHTRDGPDDIREVALIMYTSGTTGRPKGAMLSYENLLAAEHHTDHRIPTRRARRSSCGDIAVVPYSRNQSDSPLPKSRTDDSHRPALLGLPFECRIECLGQGNIRARAHRSHRLCDTQLRPDSRETL